MSRWAAIQANALTAGRWLRAWVGWPEALLLGLIAVAAVGLVTLPEVPGTDIGRDGQAPRWQAPPVPSSTSSPPVDYTALRQQPLFYRARAVYVVPPPEPPKPEPQVDLVATLIRPGQSVAILVPRAGGAAQRVRRGDMVESWRVGDIVLGKVTLLTGAQRLELLARGAASGTAAQTKSMKQGYNVLGNVPPRTRTAGSGLVLSAAGTVAPAASAARTYRPPPP